MRSLAILLMVGLFLFVACEGPPGPQGERGPEGPQGEAGQAGGSPGTQATSAATVRLTIPSFRPYNDRDFRAMDSRDLVALADGGVGAVDNYEMTASFYGTSSYGYSRRLIQFRVDIKWIGEGIADELMRENFLQTKLLFVSPSGESARGSLMSTSPDSDFESLFSGLVSNRNESLPDEAGAFFLLFSPHPYKEVLVWTVDLPFL